jgi:hypothetical protein
MFVQQERIVSTIKGPEPEKILEVAAGVDAVGRSYLELRRLSWGKGVGWYCQQVLRLDPQETTALKQAFRELQRRTLRRQESRGQVLLFPRRAITNGQSLQKTSRQKKTLGEK